MPCRVLQPINAPRELKIDELHGTTQIRICGLHDEMIVIIHEFEMMNLYRKPPDRLQQHRNKNFIGRWCEAKLPTVGSGRDVIRKFVLLDAPRSHRGLMLANTVPSSLPHKTPSGGRHDDDVYRFRTLVSKTCPIFGHLAP